MAVDDFVHLHVASSASMRFGACHPDELVARAAALGQSALALTDRDGLYGAVRFVRACSEAGIAPVLGVDLALDGQGALLPPLSDVREVSKAIAFAVARQAQADGVALSSSDEAIRASIERNFWYPRYRSYRRSAF